MPSPETGPADSLHQAFEAQARATPDRIAVSASDQQLSYAELDRRSSALAQELGRAGVGMESCVGLCAERGIEMIVGILAILKSGGAYIPIDPEYPADRIRYIVEDGPMAAIVCSPGAARHVAEFGIRVVLTTEGPTGRISDAPPCRVTRRNLAYVIYTSGSTGRPKGVLIEHGSVLHLLERTLDRFECDRRDVWAQFHSISFDFSVWEIWGALLTGARLVIVPSRLARAPGAFSAFVDQQRISVLNQTPTAFRRFSQAYLARPQAATPLRLVIFGGEALSMRMLDPWLSRFGDTSPSLFNMYGITETTVHVTCQRIRSEHAGETRSVIGSPIDGLRIKLLDAEGRPVAPGCPGRIHVSGAGVARGYRNRPDLTAQRFVADPDPTAAGGRLYDSGDVGVRLESGALAYLGRADDQIKISGYRIEPGEVESCLLGHQDVAAALVMSQELGPDAVGLIAYVIMSGTEPRPAGHCERVAAALAQIARTKLPAYMRPGEYRFIPAFPLTAHGKIDRSTLQNAPSLRTSEAGCAS